MTLENLVGRGLQAEPASGDELRRYLDRITTRLADANNSSISLESRFDLAYEAVLQIGLAGLRGHGYRPDSRGGHHVTALQTLNVTLGYPQSKLRLLDQFRRQRAQGLYDGSFEPTAAELQSLLETGRDLHQHLVRWLQLERPDWLKADPK